MMLRSDVRQDPHEARSSRPWHSSSAPHAVLAIRFHAIGDVAITLPALSALRSRYPSTHIDLLTSDPAAPLASSTDIFRRVIAIPIPSSRPARVLSSVARGLTLRGERYDCVLDLQRNPSSRIVRMLADAPSWSEFDRFSPRPAIERTISTIQAAGLSAGPIFPVKPSPDVVERGREMLLAEGWDGSRPLIGLNPAGIWSSRQWPAASYISAARLLLHTMDAHCLFLGTERMKERSAAIAAGIGERVIDLTGRTTVREAFGVVQHARAMVSEDSGLMHMAWISGVPTVALFGSSRHDWSRPVGDHTYLFHAGDLDCGACMEPACRFGDTHCLTRVTPERVVEEALRLTAFRGKDVSA